MKSGLWVLQLELLDLWEHGDLLFTLGSDWEHMCPCARPLHQGIQLDETCYSQKQVCISSNLDPGSCSEDLGAPAWAWTMSSAPLRGKEDWVPSTSRTPEAGEIVQWLRRLPVIFIFSSSSVIIIRTITTTWWVYLGNRRSDSKLSWESISGYRWTSS